MTYRLPRLDNVSTVKTRGDSSKPRYGREMSARRAYLNNKSAMDIENETEGVIYQKLYYRIEGGDKHPLTLDLTQFDALLKSLEWTPEEFSRATGIKLPEAFRMYFDTQKAEQSTHRAAVDLTPYTIPTYSAGTGPAWNLNEAEMVTLMLPTLKGYDQSKIIGLWARGDSMSPYLEDGALAIVYLDPGRAEIGKAVSVWFADDGVCVKRYWGEDESGNLRLGNDNLTHPRAFSPPLGSRITGVVIGRWNRD